MSTTVASATSRVLNSGIASRIMGPEEAAALIHSGHQIGMSGFTGSGYPKAVPLALARRIADANLRGQKFQVSVFTGASTGPELAERSLWREACICVFLIQRGRNGLHGYSPQPCRPVR